MTPERWQHIEHLYHAALAREDGEREAWLKVACGSDDTIRAEVESMLAHDASAEAFFAAPKARVSRSRHRADEEVGRGQLVRVVRERTMYFATVD